MIDEIGEDDAPEVFLPTTVLLHHVESALAINQR
jgi:hypothetical protein